MSGCRCRLDQRRWYMLDMGIVSVGWRNQGDLLVSHQTTAMPHLVCVATCTLVRCSANLRLVGGGQPSKGPLPEAWTRLLQAMLEFNESFPYDFMSAFTGPLFDCTSPSFESAGVVRMPGGPARTLSGVCLDKSSASSGCRRARNQQRHHRSSNKRVVRPTICLAPRRKRAFITNHWP